VAPVGFKGKVEHPFEMAIENFRLNESNFAK
jgi:hypothetical protein